MKILEIGSALFDWGGIERYLAYLSGALEERGHEVWTTVPPGSPLDQRLTGRKVHIAVKRQFQFTRLAAYLRLFRAHRFDIVNAHFSPDFIVPAFAARLTRQPCRILTRHVVVYWSPVKVRRYTRLFTHFVGVSDAVKNKLTDAGVPSDLIYVAKAGVPALEPTLTSNAVRQQLALSGFKAGFFGRVVEDKGVQTIAEAAQDLPPETFQVFGDGPLLQALRANPQGVRYHGRVEDVVNPMNAMDCVVIPSLWEEAFPYSALEAMSLGKPVIATRSGGLPELVTEDVTGKLFDKRDAAGLVRAMRELMSSPSDLARLGQAARELHRSEYTVEKFGERMEAAYLAASTRN